VLNSPVGRNASNAFERREAERNVHCVVSRPQFFFFCLTPLELELGTPTRYSVYLPKIGGERYLVISKVKKYVPRQLKYPLQRVKRRLLLELNRPTGFNKTDLIHVISSRLNLRNYLELCTPTAGRRYGEIERTRFRTARRLIYNCPTGFDDGQPIDYRVADISIEDAIRTLQQRSAQVDICLVDGLHTYDCTTRDLTSTYDILSDGGVLVVHDCAPVTEAVASPIFAPNDWSGESYRSYLDFVLTRDDLDYFTVDIDYGCGIIIKNRAVDMVGPVDPRLVAEWFEVHDDSQAALRFFFKHRARLLRLTSGKNFVRSFSSSSLRSSGGKTEQRQSETSTYRAQ
jgi:hypothetical protein